MQNVFDVIKEREKVMEQYYRDLVKKTTNQGIKSILLMIADEESKHFDHFESMKKQIANPEKSTLLVDSRKILKSLKQNKNITPINISQLELYEKIRDEEKRSEILFKDLANNENDRELKSIYDQVANEEHRHYLIMDEICEFIARPNDWVESPEFSNLDHY
ncbi:MAG: hypothetical protein A2202_04335 [Bdellovibrionales bacterium RIFOXYA1_FULL_36_14]|nr:MAG: hypothetical protein A2202_04335 [Bdellovibrionales bacterium RIFOXYA1_FULL_36_14]